MSDISEKTIPFIYRVRVCYDGKSFELHFIDREVADTTIKVFNNMLNEKGKKSVIYVCECLHVYTPEMIIEDARRLNYLLED